MAEEEKEEEEEVVVVVVMKEGGVGGRGTDRKTWPTLTVGWLSFH